MFPEEHPSRAEEILVRDGVQKQEQVSLDHRSGRHGLVHLLGCGHGRRVLQDVERTSAQRLEGTLREDLGQLRKKISVARHPGSWIEEAERRPGVHPNSGRLACSVSIRVILSTS